MGCGASKLDNLPAVALCRDRCNFVENALHHSYALADAHVAYTQSLNTLGLTLTQLFDHNLINLNSHIPADDSKSSSTSDSHIQFHSDSEDEKDDRNQQTLNSSRNENSTAYRYNNYEFSNNRDWESTTPPPPPPSSSAWDFLNFFEPLEKYQAHYSPNRVEESRKIEVNNSAENDQVGPTSLREKKKTNVEQSTEEAESKSQIGQRCVSEVMRQVQILFETASQSGNDVLKMFDPCRFRYHHHKFSVYQVVLSAVTPLKLGATSHQGSDEDLVINSNNLTVTMKKLCMWEKKLYDEVKAEEKLRLNYAKKCKEMKNLEHKGAETLKLETTRTTVRTLSTKLKIGIQAIDNMSITINKLRDDELWPQISELVQRLHEMWKAMLECHKCQYQSILEAKSLDAIAAVSNLDNAHLELAIRLKYELQNLDTNFSNWIEAQKGYINALNGWLLKCLPYEPEETPDGGTVPFSPGRIGAPPVFVIAHHWSQAMDWLSEKEVTEAMHGFLTSVNQLLEQHNVDLQQMVTANKDMDQKVKFMEREEQKMHKVMQTPKTEQQGKIANIGSLQSGLKQIFVAIERFAADSKQAYDELNARIEEGKFTKMNMTCP